MKSMAKIYADQIHNHFQVMYPTWLPGTPLKLGDFGKMDRNVFVRIGNINNSYGIGFKERSDQHLNKMEFKSANATEVIFTAKGSGAVEGAANVNAGIEINFSSKNSVFFFAANCAIVSIEDQRKRGEEILELFKQRKWNEDYVVVTRIVKAGATTVIISGGNQSSISLEAGADTVQTIDLADASLKLTVKRERNIGYKSIAETGLNPLIGLSGIKHKGFFDKKPSFEPMSLRVADIGAFREFAEEEGESIDDSFYFGEI